MAAKRTSQLLRGNTSVHATATIDSQRNVLIIEIPLQAPTPSTTGRSRIVASTRGFVATEAKVEGHPISISVNAVIK